MKVVVGASGKAHVPWGLKSPAYPVRGSASRRQGRVARRTLKETLGKTLTDDSKNQHMRRQPRKNKIDTYTVVSMICGGDKRGGSVHYPGRSAMSRESATATESWREGIAGVSRGHSRAWRQAEGEGIRKFVLGHNLREGKNDQRERKRRSATI